MRIESVERLVGERVVLRQWCDADRAPFAAMNSDPEVMKFFPTTLSRAESDAFVDRIQSSFEVEGFGLWAVEVESMFIGFTGLNRTSFETPMGPHLEIGWRLARRAWGRGLASEAARLVLSDAFGRLGFDVVYSFTTETNSASESVMKRIGMRRRTEFDFDHPRTPGWWGQRHIVYSIDNGIKDSDLL